ncbi:hypothetical protein GCM10015536_34870 [Streptomyces griseomycini]|nr:hypothetical protein GCM10015536_34870 [Streptomyces griseomycini]
MGEGDAEAVSKVAEAIHGPGPELVPNGEGGPVTEFLLRIDTDAGPARSRS